jgi:L-asparaginase
VIVIANNEGKSGIPTAARLLAAGAPGLDALEAGIELVEDDEEVCTVGRGGWPNLLGEVELDASAMHGTSLRTGAVGGLKGFRHPIRVARQVLERLPHELLIGAGAERFAAEIGAERIELLTERSRGAWQRWFEAEVSEEDRRRWPEVALERYCHDAVDPEIGKDTTVFLAQDAERHLVSGTSTSGWGWKYPGRLGDSPIIGAGSYADSRYGACACTGAGEMTIRAGTSRAVVLYMKMGMSVGRAVEEAINDMRALQGGLLNRVTIHAIDNRGNHRVVAVNGMEGNHYWLWTPGMDAPQAFPAEIVEITPQVTRKKGAMSVYTRPDGMPG